MASSVRVRLLTHNIRYAAAQRFPGERPWSVRGPRLCAELVFHTPIASAFVCLQEVLHLQLVDISHAMNQATGDDAWAYIGVGRDDGERVGEYSPIFYRPAEWRLESWKTLWLSETPNTPSRGWDAASVRIVTLGRFQHRQTGQRLVVMNTHLDDQGSVARVESARILREVVSDEAKGYIPVVLAGDFNSTPDDAAYAIITSGSESLKDLADDIPVSQRYGNEMTYTSFGESTPSRLDYVFVSRHAPLVSLTYAVVSNKHDDKIFVSDHRAVVADIEILSGSVA